MLEGLIIRGVGGFYYVETESGLYQCRARGLFKKQGITPMVGDRVQIDLTEEEEVEGYVTEIHPRRNSFIRPPIANIDLLLVVAACRHPAPNIATACAPTTASAAARRSTVPILRRSKRQTNKS